MNIEELYKHYRTADMEGKKEEFIKSLTREEKNALMDCISKKVNKGILAAILKLSERIKK
jgi:hypothetical protein